MGESEFDNSKIETKVDQPVVFMAKMAVCAFLGALTAVFISAGVAGVQALLG